MPRAVLRDGFLTMDVNRRANATDVQYVAEVSSDLSTWSAAANAVQTITPTEYSGNPNMLSFRALPGTQAFTSYFANTGNNIPLFQVFRKRYGDNYMASLTSVVIASSGFAAACLVSMATLLRESAVRS